MGAEPCVNLGVDGESLELGDIVGGGMPHPEGWLPSEPAASAATSVGVANTMKPRCTANA
ncbi:MAG: hypothetical protein RLZZ565_1348, partial [Planctomycetota bacterium]